MLLATEHDKHTRLPPSKRAASLPSDLKVLVGYFLLQSLATLCGIDSHSDRYRRDFVAFLWRRRSTDAAFRRGTLARSRYRQTRQE